MNFANKYFEKYNSRPKFINEAPEKDLFITVVIPCYNEPNLITSLQSLKDCNLPCNSVEIITVINSHENTENHIVEQNSKSYKEALEFAKINSTKKIKFHTIYIDNLKKKHAGVGLARKIGMDEALRRYNFINKKNGIITGFDADSTLQKNYFTEIEKLFIEKPKTKACSINFKHPISGTDFPKEIYTNIIKYELHLRYFIDALKKINFPYSYQTIGSAYAVNADIYAKQGGMNRKKAGEDFYFLQKIIPLGNYEELNTTCIYPSPRMSDRVPFGTGAAIKKLIDNNEKEYFTYNNSAFNDLDNLFKNKNQFFNNYSTKKLNSNIINFLEMNNFEEDLKNINKNSPNIHIFEKRFFDWFNTFRVIKFLNYIHETTYSKIPVKEAAIKLLEKYNINLNKTTSELELLKILRKIDTDNI